MSRTLLRTHSIEHSSTYLAQALQVSLRLKLCWSASSFDLQVNLVKGRLTRTRTDQDAVTCCLWPVTPKRLLWLAPKKKVTATIQQGSDVGQNAPPHCRIPGMVSELFSFFFWTDTASCVSSRDLNLVAYIHWCLLESASQLWKHEVCSWSEYSNTDAVLIQRAVRLPHVEHEVQRTRIKFFMEVSIAKRPFEHICRRFSIPDKNLLGGF